MSIQFNRDYTRQEAIETVLDAQEQLRNIIGSLKDVFSEDDWVMSYLIAPLAVVTDEDHGYLDSSKNLGDLLQMLQDDDADDNLSNDDDPDDDDPDDDLSALEALNRYENVCPTGDIGGQEWEGEETMTNQTTDKKHIQGIKGGAVHYGYFAYGRWWTICGAGQNGLTSNRRRTIYQNVGCAEVTCERCKAERQEAQPASQVFKVGDKVRVKADPYRIRVIGGVYGDNERYTLRLDDKTCNGSEKTYAPDALVSADVLPVNIR